MNIKIAIFASGSGTNAENIIKYFKNSSVIEISLVICNKKEAYVLERAKRAQVPALFFRKSDFEKEACVLKVLKDYKIDFIVLAGFLLKVPQNILEAYSNKIVNIHPALLPKFGGKGMYGEHVHEAVIAAGEIQTGITIHYVNSEYDSGDIIFQISCPVLSADNAQEVAKRVHALEYEYFPQVIERTVKSIFNV